jgi:hypothetical protein
MNTTINDQILAILVNLRHDFPHLTETERETIRKALWKAWYPAYDAEKRALLDTPLTPSV